MSLQAIHALKELPRSFRGNAFATQFNLNPEYARTTLRRWTVAGHLAHLPGRSDVYLNLLRFPEAIYTWKEEALLLIDPSATLTGANALRKAGWTTQIAQKPMVVLGCAKTSKLDDFHIIHRPERWFNSVARVVQNESSGGSMATLPALKPEYALMDALADPKGQWLPAPDDLDAEELEDNREALMMAGAKLSRYYRRLPGINAIMTIPDSEDVIDWYEHAFVLAREIYDGRRGYEYASGSPNSMG